jgi:hypothetical protein
MNESPNSSQQPNYSQEMAAWIEEQQKNLSPLEMKQIEYFLGDQ